MCTVNMIYQSDIFIYHIVYYVFQVYILYLYFSTHFSSGSLLDYFFITVQFCVEKGNCQYMREKLDKL